MSEPIAVLVPVDAGTLLLFWRPPLVRVVGEVDDEVVGQAKEFQLLWRAD
jgi:hypothetical protein